MDEQLNQMTLQLATYDNAIIGLQVQRDELQTQIDMYIADPSTFEENQIQGQINVLQGQLTQLKGIKG